MIRGVDPATRKVVKAAAKAEGVSVGRWVRRALAAALNASAGGPSTVDALSERLRLLEARLDVLEKSHRHAASPSPGNRLPADADATPRSDTH
jgi:hypothetical protein